APVTSVIHAWPTSVICALSLHDALPIFPALDHAGVHASDVDGIFVGVYNNGFTRQDFQGALVAMGTPELAGTPFMRTENACATRSEEHTSELQSRENLVCRLLLEKKHSI